MVSQIDAYFVQRRDLGHRTDHGRVVAAAELLADLRERRVGELAGEVHRHPARIDDVLRAAVRRGDYRASNAQRSEPRHEG
jgi:hypothetical protein